MRALRRRLSQTGQTRWIKGANGEKKLVIGDEVDDLRTDLILLDHALRGLQANAGAFQLEPEDFEPGILFLMQVLDRVERIAKALEEALPSPAPAPVLSAPGGKAA
jgi:hypothetical protein